MVSGTNNIPRVGKFSKVDMDQFVSDWLSCFPVTEADSDVPADEVIKIVADIWKGIKPPVRATAGSAGYDFYSPLDIELDPGDTIKFPTGIRVEIQPGWFLIIVPRSSLGFKYRLQLDNTVGVIDEDFSLADNQGDIHCKLSNLGTKHLSIKQGDRICQGIFLPYGITANDKAKSKRTGGLGSTGE